MSKPIAVCISDIHFNLQNLELASQALKAALKKAEHLSIPLIIAGDLQDTKAIIRGEVANRLITILSSTKVKVFILRGNHDQLSEKTGEHALNYLRPYATVVDEGRWIGTKIFLIPYQNDPAQLLALLNEPQPNRTILVMHQGFQGAHLGDYVQDKTSVSTDLVKDFTVISGHYHRHQTIGTVTYIGSPYTITFGEANDGPKGFLVLNEDGSFTRKILNLRKHVVVERTVDDAFSPMPGLNSNDLLWLKITGPASELKKLKKSELGAAHIGHSNFKLDLIPHESASPAPKDALEVLTDREALHKTIDSMSESEVQKQRLKELAHALVDG